jgi:hypothetical protein
MPYVTAVRDAFNGEIDYAVLQKTYAAGRDNRYSPPACIGTERRIVSGSPERKHISTSYVERQNLTMRMSMRHFTRLTNAFSKKVENLTAACGLHFCHYNFCRVHKTLGTSPAVSAGVADHVWTISELVGLLEAAEATPIKRGSYKPRAISD